jgi:multicomponent Na+:H+ antiporter subunit D
MHITALPVVVPMIAAALLVALRHWTPRLVNDAVATSVALAVAVLSAILLVRAAHHPFAYWMGGWRPSHMVAIGISFSVDPLGAGAALFAATLIIAALVYSWRYFDAADGLFHALMLVFLAAMAGFCLTGDLFNLLVFFELMGAVAYALTAYQIEERGPIQGAINFAITNSVGAYGIFTGVALLYARTGALNMTQIGVALAGHHPDALVVVAMVLLFVGFLTKAAAVPVHFWSADAHAVAPTPVCVLLSGAMAELGLYAVARVYWTVFAGTLGSHAEELRAILIVIGTVTALGGGILCYSQRHLKRLLAFSTISHVGVMVCGVGLLTAHGLAGTATYAIGQGFTKGALFMLVGVLVHRFATMDEFALHGRGRELKLAGALFAVGGVVLSALPGGTLFFGKSLLDGAALEAGYPWLPTVFLISSILTAGAVLRVAGRVFLGWGAAQRDEDVQARRAAAEEDESEQASRDWTPPLMLIVPAALLLAAIVIGLIPGAVPGIETAAAHLGDHAAYARWVLRDVAPDYASVVHGHIEAFDYLYAGGGTVGAVAIAGLTLFAPTLHRRLPQSLIGPLRSALTVLRELHSGHIGDYIAWWTAAAALLGGASLILLT